MRRQASSRSFKQQRGGREEGGKDQEQNKTRLGEDSDRRKRGGGGERQGERIGGSTQNLVSPSNSFRSKSNGGAPPPNSIRDTAAGPAALKRTQTLPSSQTWRGGSLLNNDPAQSFSFKAASQSQNQSQSFRSLGQLQSQQSFRASSLEQLQAQVS